MVKEVINMERIALNSDGDTRKRMKTKLEPPDGGWGWMIALATAFSNIAMIPVIQNFGLVYKERFKQLNMTGADRSIIINTNSSFGMLMGLFNGVFLNRFGYRRGAICGGLMVSFGLLASAYTNTFGGLIITYGLITSFGFGLAMSAFLLALNMYFVEKRGIAVGAAMSLTGVGSIVMPIVIDFLLDMYGVSGTLLLLGALSFNILVAAALLQPIKWHMKEVLTSTPVSKIGSVISVNYVGETVTTYEDGDDKKKKKTFGQALVQLLDLELLRDPGYINLLLGLSLAICAEMNFSLIIPFVLDDYGYTTTDTAWIMSIIACSDVVFRMLSPFIAKKLNKSCRFMYLCSLVLLIVSRTAIIFTNNFTDLVIVSLAVGVAKGFRTVFMTLLVPNYVPIEKLANATGMQYVVNGIILLIAGASIGFIRDITGTYNNTIIAVNCITFTTILMWCTEDLIKIIRKKLNAKK